MTLHSKQVCIIAMNVRKVERAAEPGYPDAKEFRKQRHLWGLAVIGAGMAMSGCDGAGGGPPPPPPQRLGGVAPPPVRHTMVAGHADHGPVTVTPPVRTAGKIKVEPKEEKPPRLPGVPPPPPPVR